MIFIKPKKEKKKKGIYIKFLATSSEIQICRIHITGGEEGRDDFLKDCLCLVECVKLAWSHRRFIRYISLHPNRSVRGHSEGGGVLCP